MSMPATEPVMLVVDDEALIRMCAAEFAQEAGYEAIEACDAREALAALEARPDVSVLFTDVAMPGGMDGLALAREVRERWPHVAVLIATGASASAGHEFPHLAKPYGLNDFMSAVERLGEGA